MMDTSFSRTFLLLRIFSTRHCIVRFSYRTASATTKRQLVIAVRAVSETSFANATSLAKTPFKITGAPSVVLETIKRGDDDDRDGTTSVILRIYEGLGGHAKAKLHVADNIHVTKASLVNLLEDELEELKLVDGVAELWFRGFQFQTVKLVIKDASAAE